MSTFNYFFVGQLKIAQTNFLVHEEHETHTRIEEEAKVPPTVRDPPAQAREPKRRTEQKHCTMRQPRTPAEKDALFGISQTAKASKKGAQKRKTMPNEAHAPH